MCVPFHMQPTPFELNSISFTLASLFFIRGRNPAGKPCPIDYWSVEWPPLEYIEGVIL